MIIEDETMSRNYVITEKQLNYNLQAHELACPKNPKNKKEDKK